MSTQEYIAEALKLIFQGISQLKEAFPEKEFTIDGRLVGDIGEVIAALEYDLTLYEVLHADHDGETSDGRKVQVKATFKDALTFKTVPDLYLGFKLYENGDHEEVYNGPGKVIFERYRYRKGIGETLLSFPVEDLKKISREISYGERVPKRQG